MATSGYKYKGYDLEEYLSKTSPYNSTLKGAVFQDGTYYQPTSSTTYGVKNAPGMGLDDVWGTRFAANINSSYKINGDGFSFAIKGSCPTGSNTSTVSFSNATAWVKWDYTNGLQYKDGSSGSWITLPNTRNTTHIIAEIVGGGGGGGGPAINEASNYKNNSFASGGGGAGGGYISAVIDLTESGEIVLTKGSGGQPGTVGKDADGGNGSEGGGSYVKTSGGATIAYARGGYGGKGATIKTGSSVGGAWSGTGAYDTSHFTTPDNSYAHWTGRCLGGAGKAGVGDNESGFKVGSAGASPSSVASYLLVGKPSTSGGAGGSTTNKGSLVVLSGGGGGGASYKGNGGKGAFLYYSGSNRYAGGNDGIGPGGGGGGGCSGRYDTGWSYYKGFAGADGYIGILYETSRLT